MTNDLNTNRNIASDSAASRNNERKAKKEGMRKGILTTTVIALLILIGAALVVNSKFKNEQKKNVAMAENQKRSYTQMLTSRDSVLNEWVVTFDQIEQDLAKVKEKEKIISMKSNDQEFTKDKKQAILKDIEYINTVLDQNRKKIASLTAQLKASGGTIKGLNDKIAALETSMKESEAEMATLKTSLSQKDFEIGQLNTRMSDAEAAIQLKDETITNQTAEINKGFVTYGTYKSLKAKGLVSKEGGFLGLGKKEALHEDFPDSLFTQVNITETKSIPVNSKAAKLITEHPTTSYELVRDKDNKIASIEIKDPQEFWKISKYAVVEIK